VFPVSSSVFPGLFPVNNLLQSVDFPVFRSRLSGPTVTCNIRASVLGFLCDRAAATVGPHSPGGHSYSRGPLSTHLISRAIGLAKARSGYFRQVKFFNRPLNTQRISRAFCYHKQRVHFVCYPRLSSSEAAQRALRDQHTRLQPSKCRGCTDRPSIHSGSCGKSHPAI